MKKLVAIVMIVLSALSANAQFVKARLQATGLTCAMCSNAINKALKKVPFIATVNPDIKNSAFDIEFKKGSDVDIDVLRKAVEDAGFYVGGLQLTVNFSDQKIANEEKVKIGKDDFRFLEVNKQQLNGEHTIRVLDKEFVTAKEYKKYNSVTRAQLERTKDDGQRVFHVTI